MKHKNKRLQKHKAPKQRELIRFRIWTVRNHSFSPTKFYQRRTRARICCLSINRRDIIKTNIYRKKKNTISRFISEGKNKFPPLGWRWKLFLRFATCDLVNRANPPRRRRPRSDCWDVRIRLDGGALVCKRYKSGYLWNLFYSVLVEECKNTVFRGKGFNYNYKSNESRNSYTSPEAESTVN